MSFEIRAPDYLDVSSIGIARPIWKQQFYVWLKTTGRDAEPQEDQIAAFLSLIGIEGLNIYNTKFPNDGTPDKMYGIVRGEHNAIANLRSLADVVKAFDDYSTPKRNKSMEFFKFMSIKQDEKQSFAEFETKLRKQALYCDAFSRKKKSGP